MTTINEDLQKAAALHGAGRLDEADATYQLVLEKDARCADALHLLGVLAQQRNQHTGAIDRIRSAIAIDDSQWAFYSNLACALQDDGQLEQALENHRRALRIGPQRAHLFSNLGTALEECGRCEEAEEQFQKALTIDPNHAETNYNLGNLLRMRGDYDGAIARYDDALRLKPHYVEAHVNMANVLQEQDKLDEAVTNYRWALEVDPKNIEALYNLARCHKSQRRFDEALTAYERVVQSQPEHAKAHFGRALILLRKGRYAEGWEEYEWRWQRADEHDLRNLPQPLWRGEPLDGKTIFVYSEQGVGDEIMFGTCLPETVTNAREVILDCDPRLVSLYSRSFPKAKVHARGEWESNDWLDAHAPVDFQVPVGNLPRYLRREEAAFPRQPRLLEPDEQRVAMWKTRFEALGAGLKIGISWRGGGGEHGDNRHRSTTLAQWAPLLTLSGCHFISLQYGESAGEIAQLHDSLDTTIHCWSDADASDDLDGLAAQISALDLVISVANLTVHMAGALGIETWALLSSRASWRWMEQREDTPWYEKVQLLRHPLDEDWDRLFEQTRVKLAGRLGITSIAAAPVAQSVRQDELEHQVLQSTTKAQVTITDSRWDLNEATISQAFAQAAAFRKQKDYHRAEGLLREITRLAPGYADAWHLLGIVARETNRYELAVEFFGKAIAVDGSQASFHFNLASALNSMARREDAIEALRRAVKLKPDFTEAYLNLGANLEQLGRLDEALIDCRIAVELSPDSAKANYNLANVRLHQGYPEEAAEIYNRVMDIDPEFARAHWNYGLAQLLRGNFSQGWPGYQWRDIAGQVKVDKFPLPIWDGSSLRNKTILIHAEQGVGDEIMFGSCLPEIVAQAKRCVLSCEPRMAPLFQRSFPTVEVHGVLRGKDAVWQPPEGIDVAMTVGSLPSLMRPNQESFPRHERYLIADPKRMAMWRQRFAALGRALNVGISWRAGGESQEQKRRTAQLEQWKELFDVEGVNFINLQYGDCAEDLAWAKANLGVDIHDWDDADPMKDLDSAAAQIASLDLVVSVGNTTVHMAGSLGIPTLVILPHVPGWRYMLTGDEMPWYRTVELFRQSEAGDWEVVVSQVAGRLRKRAFEHGQSGGGSVAKVVPSHTLVQKASSEPSRELADEPAVSEPVPRDGEAERPQAETNARPPCQDKGVTDVTDASKLASAMHYHRAGNWEIAEKLYVEVLQADPDQPDALHLLGLVAHQTNRSQRAVELIQQAITVRDDDALFRYNLGNVLKDMGRSEEAVALYDQALSLNGEFAKAHLNLGAVLKTLGRMDEAMASYERALVAKPGYVEASHNMGELLRDTGRIDEAIATWERALIANPHATEIRCALGNTLLGAGRLDEAEEQFRQVLGSRGDDTRILIALGATLQRQMRFEDAQALYRQALTIDPHLAAAHHNLGCVLREQGSHEEAIQCFQQATRVDPDFVESHLALSTTLRDLGRPNEAIEHVRAAIELRRDDASLHGQLAIVLEEAGEDDEALVCLHSAARLAPKDPRILLNLGAALERREQWEKAEGVYEALLAIDDTVAEAHFNLGNVLKKTRRYDEAIAAYSRAIQRRPDYAKAQNNLGLALRELGRYNHAIECHETALRTDPTNAEAHGNLGGALMEVGRTRQAIEAFERALAIRPDHAETRVNLALARLLKGDWSGGWSDYEWRWLAEGADYHPHHRVAVPTWDGSPLAGKTLLVHAEQGVGDEILFASCYADLIEQADRLVIDCDPRLERLLSRSFPTATVLGTKWADNLPSAIADLAVDWQIPAGSVPRFLRPTPASFPHPERFLIPDPEQKADWRQRLAALGPGLKVGISWFGGGAESEQRRRSIPLFQWCELLAVAGVHFVNLQYGDSAADVAAARDKLGVEIHTWPDVDPLTDLDHFAAQVSALDLVISVSNATVHLAGALGVSTWAFVPSVPVWRWSEAGQDSPWYTTVRLIRQKHAGDWHDVLKQTAADLHAKRDGNPPVRRDDSSALPAPNFRRHRSPTSISRGAAQRTINHETTEWKKDE